MKKYIDIHCHPSTKPFIKYASGLTHKGKPGLWDTIKYHLLLAFDEIFAKDVLDSQSSLTQLQESDPKYAAVINPVTPMEVPLAKHTMFPLAVKLALPFPRQITGDYFKTMQQNSFPYAERLVQELSFVNQTKSVWVISHSDNKLKEGVVNVVNAIEGGHSLYSDANFSDSDEEIIDRLNTILNQFRIFYLTITHLAPAPLSNHCFSMKNVSKRKVHHFYPGNEKGISEIGFQVIETCLNRPKPTLIDLKHMSLLSRIQYRKYLREHEMDMPLVATHNGCNGLTIKEWKKRILERSDEWLRTTSDNRAVFSIPVKRPDGLSLRNIQTKFNPATINLFDDDIEAVVLSNGLIGVSFDERILGRGTKKDYLEIMAEAEVKELLQIRTDNIKQVPSNQFDKKVNYYDVKMKRPTLNPKDIPKEKLRIQNTFKQQTADALYFLNNLLHMVEIANRTIYEYELAANPWEFFALGSDFDGVIDALDCCKTGKEMGEFEELLQHLLNEYITINQAYDRYAIDRTNTFESIREKLELLTHKNAKRFLNEWL